MLEEVRAPEPPIRLSAIFFEPGSAEQVAAELRSLGDVVVGVGAPLSGRHPELERRGVAPLPESPEASRLVELLGMPMFAANGNDSTEGPVPEGAYHDFPRLRDERRRRLLRAPGTAAAGEAPSVRDAAADRGAAGRPRHRRGRRPLAPPHRGARRRGLRPQRAPLRGRARVVARRPEVGVVVLPGTGLPETFRSSGVLPPVERLQLPNATGRPGWGPI